MSIMQAGARRRVITVEQHDGTLTGGQPSYATAGDWDSVKAMLNVPVNYMGVTGGEVVRGLQMEANTTGLIRILSTPRTRSIKPRMRFVMDSRTLNIVSITDREGEQRE